MIITEQKLRNEVSEFIVGTDYHFNGENRKLNWVYLGDTNGFSLFGSKLAITDRSYRKGSEGLSLNIRRDIAPEELPQTTFYHNTTYNVESREQFDSLDKIITGELI